MSQERFKALAMLPIDHELAKKLDFKDITNDFATHLAHAIWHANLNMSHQAYERKRVMLIIVILM